MKIQQVRVVLFLLSLMTALPVSAAFIEEGATGEFRVVGKVDQSVQAVGMGRKVVLRDAVRQIVPSDYSVQFGPGFDALATKRVSWRGGRPWTEVLSDSLATSPEVSVVIDGAARVVTLSASSENRSTTHSDSASEQRTWTIKAGDKISDTLSAWGREAGWQSVIWEASELVSEIEVGFTCSFEDAVTRTVQALARNGANLRVVFYGGNKVVRIMENK